MRVVARIEKLDGERYLFEGRTFDSFLTARRAMVERMRRRRMERHHHPARLTLSSMQLVEL
jgi:hypothetical protein